MLDNAALLALARSLLRRPPAARAAKHDHDEAAGVREASPPPVSMGNQTQARQLMG